MDDIKYYIWGAGTYGKRTIEFFKNDLKFESVIDSNVDIQGNKIYDLDIINPQEVMENNFKKKIIISQNVPTAIRKILKNYGLRENEDFYTLHDFIPRFFWEKNKTLAIKSVDIAVTTKCNKKCESCQTYIPFSKTKKNFSVSEVMNDLDLLFSYVSKVMNINICCGESLLNPELPDICTAIYNKYGDRYQTLSLQTNATILPTDCDMRKYNEANITIVTSNYPEQAEITAKLIELCNQNNIPWLINSSGDRSNWYDLGDPRTINTNDENVLKKRYEDCWKPGMGLNDGLLYICGAQLWTHLVVDIGEVKRGDCFDLKQPVTEESREQLSKILFREPPECGYISHCQRCLSVMNPVNKK